jgi:hypothetical protein
VIEPAGEMEVMVVQLTQIVLGELAAPVSWLLGIKYTKGVRSCLANLLNLYWKLTKITGQR